MDSYLLKNKPKKSYTLDMNKNLLVGFVKEDNTDYFLDGGQTKIYYTGKTKSFPSTVALNKLYYFMPYIKGKGVKDLYLIRIARIDKIVVSAVKQSHKAWKPVVNELQNFKDFITTPRNGRKFICHCYEEIEKKDFFAEISKSCPADYSAGAAQEGTDDITVLVGPEGDFSIDEVRLALENGYESVSLGTSRLRTETAGLVAVNMCHLARAL